MGATKVALELTRSFCYVAPIKTRMEICAKQLRGGLVGGLVTPKCGSPGRHLEI